MLFSEGIDYQVNDPFNNQGAPEIIRATQDAVNAAARANVNFFTIDPRGLQGVTSEFMELGAITSPDGTPPPNLSGLGGIAGGPMNPVNDLMEELRLSQDSLRTLADETGGFAAVNKNALEPTFSRIVESNSRYYVMGYYPPTHPRDGRFHKIEVRVKRPGFKSDSPERVRLAARQDGRRAQARRGSAARAGSEEAACRQDVVRAPRCAG